MSSFKLILRWKVRVPYVCTCELAPTMSLSLDVVWVVLPSVALAATTISPTGRTDTVRACSLTTTTTTTRDWYTLVCSRRARHTSPQTDCRERHQFQVPRAQKAARRALILQQWKAQPWRCGITAGASTIQAMLLAHRPAVHSAASATLVRLATRCSIRSAATRQPSSVSQVA